MRFVFFRTPKPKSFSFKPRYYDAKKEEWERRKAARGMDSKLNHSETLRLEMSRRWRKGKTNPNNSRISRLIVYALTAIFIVGSIYFILFTDFVEKLLALFGLINK